MYKARTVLATSLLLIACCHAQNIRRKSAYDNDKSLKNSNSDKKNVAPGSRKLKGAFFGRNEGAYDDYYYDDYYNYAGKGKKEKKKYNKGKKGKKYYDDDYYQYKKKGKKHDKKKKKKHHGKKASPSCRTVVEPAEFYMHNALQQITPGGVNTMSNGTRYEAMGTQYIFQGPLLDQDLVELEDYYVSGVCTRTWSARKEIPGVLGAAFCSLSFTIATGANFNVAGEVFDAWENNVGITGGTFEMTGVRGQSTLVAVGDDLEEEDGDFFSSPYIWGRVALVYKICPEGYWDRLIVDDIEDLEGKTYPDPFNMQ